MKKRWFALLAVAALSLAGPAAEDLAAQKPGRSYSSGRSTPSAPRPSAPSKPAAPRPTAPPKPSPPIKTSPAPKPSSPTRPSTPSVRLPTPSPPAGGRTYTAPGGSVAKAPTPPPAPRAAPSFDTLAAREQKLAESRAAYERGQQPRPTYPDAGGKPKPIQPNDPVADSVRKRLDRDAWANRQERLDRTFPRPTNPPVIVYSDPYNNFFWWWLLTRSAQERAEWAYHHRHRMDEARYRDLINKDATLEGRIRELERKKVPRDPTYTPPGLDSPDLMYTDGYVDAVFNPQPWQRHLAVQAIAIQGLAAGAIGSPALPHLAAAAAVASLRPAVRSQPGGWAAAPYPPRPRSTAGQVAVTVLLVVLVVGFLIWLVFFKRWGATCVGPAN